MRKALGQDRTYVASRTVPTRSPQRSAPSTNSPPAASAATCATKSTPSWAYGWPWPMGRAEILERLVALHDERVAEEQRGIVCWLRPDYQIPRFAAHDRGRSSRLVRWCPTRPRCAPPGNAGTDGRGRRGRESEIRRSRTNELEGGSAATLARAPSHEPDATPSDAASAGSSCSCCTPWAAPGSRLPMTASMLIGGSSNAPCRPRLVSDEMASRR